MNGFSGGEKRNEINADPDVRSQNYACLMRRLRPRYRMHSKWLDGINALRSPAFLYFNHSINQRLLDYVQPDFVHVWLTDELLNLRKWNWP